MSEEEPPRAGDPAVVRRVFDEMPLLVCATEGPEHRLVATTRAYRAFADIGDSTGLSLLGAFPASAGRRLQPIFDDVLASGEPALRRHFRIGFEAGEVFADVSVHPRRGPDGGVIGLLVHLTDPAEQPRDGLDALQRALLPDGLPVLPRLQLAAGYLLTEADSAAGGDWFDALPLPDGSVALIVGDVVGHGVTASATMGRLRILLHEQLATGAGIAAALTALDLSATRIRGAQAATVGVVVLDPATGALAHCTAGHPPPLLLTTTGEARYLATTGAGPLGVGGRFTPELVGQDRLAPGELVLLYTDGILERPGREPAASTVELARIAADQARPGEPGSAADRVCTRTLELLTRMTGHTDDITLLAAQRVTPPPDLRLRLRSTENTLAEVRERLETWLSAARVDRRDADVLRHAAVELVTNVLDHAFVDDPDVHPFDVTVSLTGQGEVRVRVADGGRWRPPVATADRGLGLHVTEHLVDGLRVEHDEHGTTAVVTHRVSTPARLLTAADLVWHPAPRSPLRRMPLLVLGEPSAPSPRLRVDGPVDAETVDEFDRTTRTAGVTGTRPLTLDLTGVTHLASAGVAALHRLRALHEGNGTRLRLYAPAGTPADMILSLVQLPHDILDPG